MSLSMIKMWISIAAMILMALAMLSIYASRFKMKPGFLKVIVTISAYLFLIIGGLMMAYVVFSGPTY